MPASTSRYFGFNFTAAAFQYNNAGTLTDVSLLYSNKVTLSPEEENITFEGDGQSRTIYVTKGLTIEYAPDVLNQAAASILFGKNAVTTGLPASYTSGTWYGDTAESGGKSVGFWAEGSAIKNVAGVETNVTLRLWIPLGTLTLGAPGDVETAKKWGPQIWRMAASRTTVDAAGAALPSVPSGGAYYAILEK